MNSALIRWLPIVCLLALAAHVARIPKFVPAKDPDPPTKKTVLALELPNRGEVKRLLGSPDAIRTATANTDWDRWFIAAYTALFISIALFHPWPLRLTLIGVALAAAAFDVWENAVIREFIRAPAAAVDSAIWLPARLKWFAFFLAVLLVAMALARSGKWWWVAAVIGALPAVAGMISAAVGSRDWIGRSTDAAIVVIALSALALPFLRPTAP